MDECGESMHCSKGNAIWFDDAVEQMGADVMRWMFASQNISGMTAQQQPYAPDAPPDAAPIVITSTPTGAVVALDGQDRGTTPLLLSVAPLVLLANTIRVTSVLMVASWFGQDTALGFFHGASSLVLFGLALVSLLVFSRMLGCSTPNLSR